MIEDTQATMIYPWHQQTWELLSSRFPEVGHGLLFYGKKGCAKNEFTARFVAWILCLNKQAQADRKSVV